MQNNIFSKASSLLSGRSLLAAAMICISLSAAAQFNQSIAVDGRYVPEYIPIDRINSFPMRERFELDINPLSYDTRGVEAAFSPELIRMPATGWRSSRNFSRARGYLDLGMGSWLNSTLSAGYRLLDSQNSTLGIRLQHNSTSLWKPNLNETFADTKQWRYDEALGVYGSHVFEGAGRFDGAIDYHIGNFNYYGFAPVWADGVSAENAPKVPTQTLNDVATRFGWQSESRPDDFKWNVAAGVRYFGYRSFYFTEDAVSSLAVGAPASRRATRETDVNIAGGLLFPFSSGSAAGLDLNADILIYSHNGNEAPSAAPNLNPYLSPAAPDNYGLVTLTPYYRFARNRFNIRLGVDIDVAARAGSEDDRYSAFHFAPDVRVDYNGGPAQIYLHLLGGSRLHTLASNYDLDYYQQPFLAAGASRPVYNPLDGSFGASFGPFAGFSAGVEFAFRVSRGQYLGGWYQAMLNCYPFRAYAGLPADFEGKQLRYTYDPAQTLNMHGWSAGLNLNYDLGRALSVKAKANYQPQKGENGYFNGYDRPRWTASIAAETNPWRTLKLRVAYDYRGVRNIYTLGSYFSDKGTHENVLTACRLPDLTMLNFGISYAFSDNFNVWLQADNLLNRRVVTLPGLPSQGITAAAGIGLIF